jgi:hypothetical protein
MNRDDEHVPSLPDDGVGIWLRNSLRDKGPLYQHLATLGFTHPDHMASAIVTVYWRRLHHRPLDIESLAKASAEWPARMAKQQAAMAAQEKQIASRMKAMVMNLAVAPFAKHALSLAPRKSGGLRARYLAPHAGGVLIGVRLNTDPGLLSPYFFDRAGRLHPARIQGVDDVRSFVVAADGLWVAGLAGDRPVLLRIGARREVLEFPRPALAQLGIDDQGRPIAVYSDAVFRWSDDGWTLARQGLKLPPSVVPPRIIDSTLFVRGEGHGENDKRLWWTRIDRDEPLIAHDQAIGFGWFDAPSYASARTGEFWLTTGNVAFGGWTVVRRSRDGEYRLATVSGQARYLEGETEPTVNISAVAALSGGEIVGAGSTGFYRIDATQIVPLARFGKASQITADNLVWRWDPSNILQLSPKRFLISGLFGGIYLLDVSDRGYALTELDERIGSPVEF